MKAIIQAATIALQGMVANANKQSEYLTYKHAYLQALDDLQDMGFSEEEAKKTLQVGMN